MPGVRRQVDGRADLIADEMDGVEVLREPDEVAIIPVVTWATAALEIVNVGWACHKPEVDVVSAENQALVAVARGEDKRRWRASQCLLDQAAIQPDRSSRRVH